MYNVLFSDNISNSGKQYETKIGCVNYIYLLTSGHTEYQTATMNKARRSVKFERKPSQRYSRRTTFERKEAELARQRERERNAK